MKKTYKLVGGSFNGSFVTTDDEVYDVPVTPSVIRTCGNEPNCLSYVQRYRKTSDKTMEYQGVFEK